MFVGIQRAGANGAGHGGPSSAGDGVSAALRKDRSVEAESGGVLARSMTFRDLDDAHLARWTALHRAQRGVANPFSSPTWVLAWYRHYVPPADQVLLWVTKRDQLVGVVPLYRDDVKLGPVALASRLGLVGSGRSTPLEIPPFLAAAGQGRAVSKAVVHAVLRRDVTWTELCLSREDGWLSPRQVAPSGTDLFTQHQQVRVCVALPLQPSWEQTRSGLKRNVKESVRRSQNRLAKDGRPWNVRHRHGDEVDGPAVERLLDLHRARSTHTDTRQRHPDAYSDPTTAGFVHDVLPRLARAGEASLLELELGGRVVAAQLVLHPPEGIYFHSSGFLPQEWALGAVTTLQAAAMQHAIEQGRRWVNFSPGPSESKSRWSDHLAVYDDIAFGHKEHAGLARYTGFFVARSLRELYRRRPAKPGSGPGSGPGTASGSATGSGPEAGLDRSDPVGV